jgi:uncharacterized protein (DUF1778 family)
MTVNRTEQLSKKNTLFHLSKKDAHYFFNALEHLPVPNKKLINAVKTDLAYIAYQPINHKERP